MTGKMKQIMIENLNEQNDRAIGDLAVINDMTKSLNDEKDDGDKKEKQRPQYLYWFLTYNNYEIDAVERLERVLQHECDWFIMQEEIGELCGTPHIQGTIKLKERQRWSQIHCWDTQAFWKPTKKVQASIEYCSRASKRAPNGRLWSYGIKKEYNLEIRKMEILGKHYGDVTFKPWQQQMIDVCERRIGNDRDIWWFWETEGNTGKTFLAKYIVCKYKCCIGGGKGADFFYQILQYIKEWGDTPDIIICDIPREAVGYINYGALEQAKNGMLYSGKYEGGVALWLDNPIVICVANEEPRYNAMSRDRWNTVEIEYDIEEAIRKKVARRTKALGW